MAPPAEDANAAFLEQLRVLQATMKEAQSPAQRPTEQAAEQAPLSATPSPAGSLACDDSATVARAPTPPPADAASGAGPRPEASCEGSTASGAAGRALWLSTAIGMGRKTAASAISVGAATAANAVTLGRAAVPVASSAARHVSKKIEGRKEAAVDAALRIALERGLRIAGARLVELLADDPDMPACVRARASGASAWLWAEVETEVMAAVLLENTYAAQRARARELERLDKEAREGGSRPLLARARASILYTLYPFDRSIWGQLRMAGFYPLLALQLCPLYGVQPLFFLLLFLLRDKADEYQLCAYILEFKGLQFATLGAMGGLIGGAQAQYCSTHGSCAHLGLGGAPGNHGTFEFEVGAFVLNVVLVWASFLLLPCSRQKGALSEDLESAGGHTPSAPGGTAAAEPHAARGPKAPAAPADLADTAARGCCGCATMGSRRGGSLRSLLVYDLLAFFLCVALAAWAAATSSGWVLRSWLHWCRVLYGLLSLPFVVFAIPPLDRVLIHAKPTAYDLHGRCVAPLTLRDRQLRRSMHTGVAHEAGAGAAADVATAASTSRAASASRTAPASRPSAGSSAMH